MTPSPAPCIDLQRFFPHTPAAESPLDLVLDAVASPHTKTAYRRALREFFSWLLSRRDLVFSKAAVQKYRAELEQRGLSPSSLNVRLSAIRRLAAEAADNGLMPPELANGVVRIRGARRHGARIGTWLSRQQSLSLLCLPDRAIARGQRDYALLSLLLGSGIRRSEAAGLRFEHFQMRDGRWVIADLVGKHARIRTIPIPAWVKEAVDEWSSIAGLRDGFLFRAVNKAGRIGAGPISPQTVYKTVGHYAALLGVRAVPHDLRRTHAKLAYSGGATLEQIRFALGHASMRTTELYLGLQQDLQDAPCDHLGLRA